MRSTPSSVTDASSAPRSTQSGSSTGSTRCSSTRGVPWKRRNRLRGDRSSKKRTSASRSASPGARSRRVPPSRRMTSSASVVRFTDDNVGLWIVPGTRVHDRARSLMGHHGLSAPSCGKLRPRGLLRAGHIRVDDGRPHRFRSRTADRIRDGSGRAPVLLQPAVRTQLARDREQPRCRVDARREPRSHRRGSQVRSGAHGSRRRLPARSSSSFRSDSSTPTRRCIWARSREPMRRKRS